MILPPPARKTRPLVPSARGEDGARAGHARVPELRAAALLDWDPFAARPVRGGRNVRRAADLKKANERMN